MSNALSKTRQAGFTLVELVIVILILGILSAVALPRFINLGADARKAKAEGIYGAVRSATQIVRAGALIRGISNGNIDVDGGQVAVVNGFPAATTAGIVVAAGLSSSDDKVTVVPDASTSPPSLTITIDGAKTPASCRITYTEATATTAASATLAAGDC